MSDSQSQISSTTSRAGTYKHCMAAECGGAKVSASNLSKHMKKDGHQQVEVKKCEGAECKLCQDLESKA